MTPQNIQHLKPLTSLRFFFALMVFCCHINFLNRSDHQWVRDLYNDVLLEGYLGVSFFFILSGFIISYNYLEHFSAEAITFRKFMTARIARLYPLTLLCIILAIPEYVFRHLDHGATTLATALIANLLLIQSYIPVKDIYLSYNYPDWSISTEMFFYLMFPIIAWSYQTWSGSRWTRIFWIIPVASLVPIFMYTVPEYLHHAIFYIHPFVRIVDFSLGIMLYIIYKQYGDYLRSKVGTMHEVLAILIFAAFFSVHGTIPDQYRFSVFYWIPMLVVILVFACQGGKISRLLSHRYLLILGEASFGFYLFHQLVIRHFLFINVRTFNIKNEAVMIIVMFTISLALSLGSYFFFEQKANRFVKRILTAKVDN